jgi:Ca2+-binding RTX toxin-like protein
VFAVAAVVAPGTQAGDGPVAGACDRRLFSEAWGDGWAGDHPDQTVSAQVYDVRTGCTYDLHRGVVLTTASVHKIEILAGVLLEAQNENRALTTWEWDRVRPMITESANTEASQLRAAIGGSTRMRELDDLFGMDDTVARDPWGITATTAADQVQLLRHAFLNVDGLFTTYSLDVFADTMGSVTGSQRWGVAAGVPHSWSVALKNGFYPATGRGWRINSSGVVSERSGEVAYLVTILSEGWPAMSPGIDAVEQVARHVSNRLAPREPSCRRPTIVGTPGPDVLTGTPRNDAISGGAGSDVINGGRGHDVICGGPGADLIDGGAGRDVLRGGGGADMLRGGQGGDVLIGGPGRDVLVGSVGRDLLVGGEGADELRGARHDDRLEAGGGNDLLDGEGGDDLLLGGGGTDRCVDPGSYESWLVHSGCERFGP